ncbi:S8 family serine peptidase [Streptomyces sp. AK02-01A]|uniref:S8 family serine peptidase n=1 Tax=Streptomyces sp. AK02-01A TaxID=3028648 RepID=UPI0029BF0508|nr:S8 family serine peptidase [Streptomyces sp. AK02-01A]MDX3854851.1 S8 family serine peptidase [Streptomyces sp. AK02-01A]
MSSAFRSRGLRLPALLLAFGISAATLGGGSAVARDTGPAAPPASAGRAKIDPKLLQRMESAGARGSGRVEAAVVLRDRPGLPDRGTEARQVRGELSRTAQSVQSPVVDMVEARGDEVLNTFWLKNMVLVKATPETLNELAELAPVDHIIPNFTLKVPPATRAETSRAAVAEPTTWGLAKIGADRVQSERKVTGEGVRVAVLDTGVDIAHPDLAGKLATDKASDPSYPGGWIEFSGTGEPVPSEPHDSSYHGTHVAGTVAGGNASGTQVGVAPGVDLMAGLIIPGGSGTLAQVIAGMQWAIAPYAADGTPAGEPADVISMSLGAEGYSDELVEPTRNIYRAGVFPSFAIGNECVNGSASPGNVYEAVSVGATDGGDDVADFSCGEVVDRSDWIDAPAEWPESYVVPDISAPGVDVLSTLPGGEYGMLSGTSMATPHVSGTVALMLQANPELTVDDTLDILAGTSFFDERYGARPNPRFGWGRIDAYAAVTEAGLKSGVRGTVADARTGKPLAGVTVARADTGREVETDKDGRFEIRLAAGNQELRFSRFGYQPGTVRTRVITDRYTDVRPRLTPTPRGKITGRVTYGPTGTTVPGATVSVLDVPDTLVATTDRDGRYTIRDVPEGSYQVSASAAGISRSQPVPVEVKKRRLTGHADPRLPRPSATERVSLTPEGKQVNQDAWWPKVSADGSTVVFASFASNLVDGDTNGDLDIFVTDLGTRSTERVSVASDGAEGNGFSLTPTLGQDGRYIGFSSGATNLVTGDTNEQTDSFVHDRRTGVTERVSVTSDGKEADGLSSAPSFSADGRFAVFNSDAANLVPGDTNDTTDVFVHDRQTGRTDRISQTPGGAGGDGGSREQSISADGRYVAFQSNATNLVAGDTDGATDVFVHDRQTGTTTLIPGPVPDANNTGPTISADGQVVSFGTDNGKIYVYDRRTGATEQVAVASDGTEGDDWSFAPSLSTDGHLVAFYSSATNLVPGDTNGMADIFVRDRTAGTVQRISDGLEGAGGDGTSDLPSISGDGRYVAFESTSANLVADDTNRRSDIFVHDRVAGPEARFAWSGLSITPDTARAGARVRVTAEVKNVGEKAGSYQAVLLVGDEVEQRRTVEVRQGRSVRLTFDVRRKEAGTYTVTVGPLTGQFTVRR